MENKNPVQQRPTNLFGNNPDKEFYLWVDAKNYMIFHNIHITGQIFSNPASHIDAASEDNLLFIPNPRYKGGFISPYQNNIVKRMRAEYYLDIYRPKHYPTRMHALFICNTKNDAVEYSKAHPDHTKDRILISGSPIGTHRYSIHDSGWFDFLCREHSIDENTAKNCALSYWNGLNITDCKLQSYGNAWSQLPTPEVLFCGELKISDESKTEITSKFREAYEREPWKYPFVNF